MTDCDSYLQKFRERIRNVSIWDAVIATCISAGILYIAGSGRDYLISAFNPSSTINEIPTASNLPNSVIEEKLNLLKTIDDYLKNEMEPTIKNGFDLINNWKDQINQAGFESFVKKVDDFVQKCKEEKTYLDQIRTENYHFIDMRTLLERPYDQELEKTTIEFKKAIESLSPSDPLGGDPAFTIGPYSEKLGSNLDAARAWIGETRGAITSKRAELSN